MHYTTRHNQIRIVLVLLTLILVTGMFTANVPTKVFADSKILKQDTNQKANCDTVGADRPVSDSCNQQSTNIVSNGIPTAAKFTGNLLIKELCFDGGCPILAFNIIITGNNPQPPAFTFTGFSNSQLVTLNPGSFKITESTAVFPFELLSFRGDCIGGQTSGTQAQATGTINAGQHLTCTIANFAG